MNEGGWLERGRKEGWDRNNDFLLLHMTNIWIFLMHLFLYLVKGSSLVQGFLHFQTSVIVEYFPPTHHLF